MAHLVVVLRVLRVSKCTLDPWHARPALLCQLQVHLVAGSCGSGAVQALVHKAAQAHVVADDVQHAHHLAEDEHPAAGPAPQSGSLILQSGQVHCRPVWAGQVQSCP